MSAWIRMIADEDADETLLEALTLARTPHGTVDNVMRVHSLRPATMQGHMRLYKAVLHDDANSLPLWIQETLAAYVSILNSCEYSFANHWANARHLINDTQRAIEIEEALRNDAFTGVFNDAQIALLQYTHKLTLHPADIKQTDVQALKDNGYDDGEILETNQIIAYFNYVNRLLNGLGVTTDGDIVGFYS